MRRRSGQAEKPSAEVPDNRGQQQREHHGKAAGGADFQNQGSPQKTEFKVR